MSILISGGIRIPSGKLSISIDSPSETTARYWRLETQGTGSNTSGNSISELKMTFDASSNLLNSFTLTSIGGAFHGSFPITNINDTVAETVSGTNIGYVASGNMDFYVDFGAANEKDVSVYSIAPQGNVGDTSTNTPTAFNVYKSDNAVDWNLVKSFSSISTGIGPWNPGTFRDFDLTA